MKSLEAVHFFQQGLYPLIDLLVLLLPQVSVAKRPVVSTSSLLVIGQFWIICPVAFVALLLSIVKALLDNLWLHIKQNCIGIYLFLLRLLEVGINHFLLDEFTADLLLILVWSYVVDQLVKECLTYLVSTLTNLD
jgi:hypothetical protein